MRGSAPTGHSPSAVAVDEATDTIYVANGNNANGSPPGGNTVSVLDGRVCSSHAVRHCAGRWPTVSVGNEPSSLTVDPSTHTVYVTNIDDNTVSVVNGRTCNARVTSGCGQTPTTVPVGSAPIGVFADAENHTLYVGNFADATVSIIDTAHCNGTGSTGCPTTAPPTVAVGDGPGDVDVNPLTHTAYVTTFYGLTAFDTATCNATTQAGCQKVGTFTLCTDCYGSFSAKVDSVTNTIYQGDGDSSIAAIDGRACNADNLSGCATAPFGLVALHAPSFEHVLWLAVDTQRHTLYALLHKDDAVVVIDTLRCNGAHVAVCAKIRPRYVHTGTNPQSIALNGNTHTLYVANQIDDTVSVIDAARCNAKVAAGCRVLPPSAGVPGASAIAVDPTTSTAYVASNGNAVAMIDTRGCNAFHPQGCGRKPPAVTVGTFPAAIAVDGATHTAYVANAGDDTGHGPSVTLLDTRRCNAHPSGCAASATVHISAGSPTSVAVNLATHALYVGSVTPDGVNVVLVFNGSTCNVEALGGCQQPPSVVPLGPKLGPSQACGGWFVDVAVNARSNTVYATNVEGCGGRGDKVYVIDGAACGATDRSGCGAPIGSVTAGYNPFGLAVDPTRNTIYAALASDYEFAGSVAVIDGATCDRLDTSGCAKPPELVAAGFGSQGVVVDPVTHLGYVTNEQDASVTVIGGKPCTSPGQIRCHGRSRAVPVDDYPAATALDPSVRTAYVTSPSRGTVSVVRLRRS